MSVPHGYDLSPADRLLLRGRPPAQALRWCERAAGRGATVAGVRALEGGTSSAVHAIDVRTAGGHERALVLRRFVRADWLAREPDTAVREAQALHLVAGIAVPTPGSSPWIRTVPRPELPPS